jgi:hypothetical protein
LRVVARDPDPAKVGRPFSAAAVELALASYPGFTMTAPPGRGAPYGVFEPGYVDAALVPHRVTQPDGVTVSIEPSPLRAAAAVDGDSPPPVRRDFGPTSVAPLGTIAGARSGDKGGSANIGVWVRSDDEFAWLNQTLTSELLGELLPEVAELTIRRYALPNLRAVNFVIEGVLGRGVADNVRFDPQAKGMGEWLRSRPVPIPVNSGSPPISKSGTRWSGDICAPPSLPSPGDTSCLTRTIGSATASFRGRPTSSPPNWACSASGYPRRSVARAVT